MPDLRSALQTALAKQQSGVIQHTLNEWEDHENQIRQPQQTQPQEKPQMQITMTEPKTTHPYKNNVTRATFDSIKHYPNLTAREHSNILGKLGYKSNSVTAVISLLIKSKQVFRDMDSRLTAVVPEFVTVPNAVKNGKVKLHKALTERRRKQLVRESVEQRSKSKQKPTLKPAKGITALAVTPPAPQVQESAPQPRHSINIVRADWSPAAEVNKLNVMQARQLFDYLKEVFGG